MRIIIVLLWLNHLLQSVVYLNTTQSSAIIYFLGHINYAKGRFYKCFIINNIHSLRDIIIIVSIVVPHFIIDLH